MRDHTAVAVSLPQHEVILVSSSPRCPLRGDTG
ncbi:hypothetical protein QFZ55_006927 [Streptomyces luteogriseus]|nr:hypothetical protein [Streptomyces luteogriseus]